MLDQIAELKTRLDEVKKDKTIFDSAKSISGLEIGISNANLLCDKLIDFYQGDDSAYFPMCITKQVTTHVTDGNAQLDMFLRNDISQGQKLQENLDKLYALCLQSGILSFGFEGKELSHLLDIAKRESQSIEGDVAELRELIDQRKSEMQSLFEAWKAQIDGFSEAEQRKMSEKSEATVANIDKLANEFKSTVSQNLEALDANIATANELGDKIAQSEQAAQVKSDDISHLCNKANQALEGIRKKEQESAVAKTSVDEKNATAENLLGQIQSKLDNINQIVSQISAKNNTADEALAAIQERKNAADDFHTEVETYKDEMLGATKRAKADYSLLKEECDAELTRYSADTKDILDQNVGYQEQIKDILAKAVSGGLFKVFSRRQEILADGTRFWKWAVVVSSALLAGGILLVAWICGEKPDIIFFVRLAIMIPLAFLMFFAATQYKKERQAEEEYAFKSAISLSLEPYRDLLVRMRKEDQEEADFVKRLMEDVFDNPVMRLFNIEEEEERMAKMILNFLKKLPKDKSSAVIEDVSKKILG